MRSLRGVDDAPIIAQEHIESDFLVFNTGALAPQRERARPSPLHKKLAD